MYTLQQFFLSSTDSYEFEVPRECHLIKKMSGLTPEGCLYVEIDPPIIGQNYGLGDKDIDKVILVKRLENISINPINEWPAYVHIARPLQNFNEHKVITSDDIQMIAWGELYPTYDRALAKK